MRPPPQCWRRAELGSPVHPTPPSIPQLRPFPATSPFHVGCRVFRAPLVHLLNTFPQFNRMSHPCLWVDEILRILARRLVASGAKATAVALACCCKSFEDPVLDALWETQDRLLPLLKALPGNVWKVRSGQFVSQLSVCVFSPSNFSTGEVFEQNPDEGGMESFPKICSRNTDAQSGRLQGPDNSERSFSVTTPYRQRTFAPEAGDLRVRKSH